MSKELKLITSLCEALGFEVKISNDYRPRLEDERICDRSRIFFLNDVEGRRLKYKQGGALIIDKNGMYTSELIEPEITYKLIKVDDE